MSSPENTRPQYTGTSYVSHSVASIVFGFTLNNASFSIVAASPDDEGGDALVPADYNFDDSIEGKILDEIIDLSVHDGDGVWSTAKQQATRRLKKQLADLAVDACLPTMRRLAPTEIPPAQTLQDTLYPPTYTLQVFTEDGKLACRIIQSHRGVIGLLLSYISHKHCSLHALLAGVEDGTVAPSEAAPCLRQKWARQIRKTLAGLHGLGILWRDLRTHNVLIDDNGDAVVLDFGGGNTVGWVDNDKYATMEDEEQGLMRIMEALGVEV